MVEPKPPPVLVPLRRRSVRLAGWLSVVPGVGQLYNRQPRKAAIFFGLVAGLFLLTINIPAATDLLVAWWRPRGGAMVLLSLAVQMLSLLLFIGTFLAAFLFWYAAFHDARVTARDMNADRPLSSGRWWLFHR